ncbi:MAG: ATP-binding protein [Candidatus Melainabacteria bacterium]|nr:ATP-binding protein [Candidatus Melainabacteria bacterium]
MNQTSTIAHPHQGSGNPHCLAAFDFAFNALDPVQVHEIATAAFVGRGENLLLVGGAGTGKTVIAMEVRQQATARGLSCEYLHSVSSHFAEEQLVAHGPGFMGSTGNQHGLRENLLDCDLLLVDEAERWIEAAPVAFMLLLGRRIELGKSNILVIPSYGWKRIFSKEASLRRHSMMEFDNPAFLLGSEAEQRSEWGMMLVRERYMPLPQLLAILGIDFALPTAEGDQPLQSALPASLVSRHVPKPFPKAPVWHTLYTGENSYREVLRRRG